MSTRKPTPGRGHRARASARNRVHHITTVTPASLSDLAYDDSAPEVIDDLAALQLVNPSVKDYANFARNLPSLVQIAERAFFYADQNKRFFELAVATSSEVVAADVSTVHANVLLHNAAVVAVAVLPALRPSDRHASRGVGHAFQRVDDDDIVVQRYARAAFGLDVGDAAILSEDALAFAAARPRRAADHGPGTVHPLEHRAALRSFFNQPADLDALDLIIKRHSCAIENIEVAFEADELSPEDYQLLEAAHASAMLQYWIAVARFALSHAPEILLSDARADRAHERADQRDRDRRRDRTLQPRDDQRACVSVSLRRHGAPAQPGLAILACGSPMKVSRTTDR